MAEDISDLDEADEAAGAEEALSALQAENAALKDQAMRYAAEIENTKRRSEREANDARAYAIQKFARDLLDAADNLSRALQAAPKDDGDPAVKTLVTGVDMTEKALQTAFERNGLKRVHPARGERFDPNLHQAMMEQSAEGVAPGAVISVMQTGYELFGRIIRPALVAVTPKVGSANPGSANPGSATSGAAATATGAAPADAYAAQEGLDVGSAVDAKA